MAFSVEGKCRAQSLIRKATPLIPLEIFYLHAPPPVDERADFIRAIKPAMDFIFRELKRGERPEVIRAGFINFMKPRWDVFSDPQYQGKKSTYPVWFLHMLTYFIEVVMPRLEKHKILVETIPEASSKPDGIFIELGPDDSPCDPEEEIHGITL
jgi:hypothetical protein